MKVRLRQLRYILAAARHGSLTAAAKSLYVSQPAISVAINQLEELYNRPLFVRRRGSGVQLTPFGRSFIAQAKHVLAQIDELEAIAKDAGALSGQFMLGCFEDLAPFCVPGILARLRSKHPGIHVMVREEGFDTLGVRLAEGTLDLAITYDLGLPPNATTQELCELPPCAMLPAGHPLASQPQVTLAQLAREQLVLTDQPHSWQHMLELFRMHGLSPSNAQRIGSLELQRGMVANGLGVAIAYSRPATDVSYDGLPIVIRPIADELPIQRILIVFQQEAALTAAIMACIDEVHSWFQENRASDSPGKPDPATTGKPSQGR